MGLTECLQYAKALLHPGNQTQEELYDVSRMYESFTTFCEGCTSVCYLDHV